MSLLRKGHWPDGLTGRVLYLGILPAWGLPGLADWACHRRSRIEDPERGGLRESLLHILMFAEGAIPLGLTLLAETNPLAVSVLTGSAVLHEATANWDLRVAVESDREISPFEQQIHTALEAIPFVVCLLSALQMSSTRGTAHPRWRIRRKSHPLPAAYVAAVLLVTGVTGVLPHLEELWRCARTAASDGGGGHIDMAPIVTVSPKPAVSAPSAGN